MLGLRSPLRLEQRSQGASERDLSTKYANRHDQRRSPTSEPRERVCAGRFETGRGGLALFGQRPSAPVAPGRKDGVSHHSPHGSVRINGRPHRIGARVHVDRRRAVITDRNRRGTVVARTPWPTAGNDLRISRGVGEGEAVARVGDIETGPAGTVEIDRLGGGRRTEPRHDKRQQGCLHGCKANKAQRRRLASGICDPARRPFAATRGMLDKKACRLSDPTPWP